jgi:hypothetical protein
MNFAKGRAHLLMDKTDGSYGGTMTATTTSTDLMRISFDKQYTTAIDKFYVYQTSSSPGGNITATLYSCSSSAFAKDVALASVNVSALSAAGVLEIQFPTTPVISAHEVYFIELLSDIAVTFIVYQRDSINISTGMHWTYQKTGSTVYFNISGFAIKTTDGETSGRLYSASVITARFNYTNPSTYTELIMSIINPAQVSVCGITLKGFYYSVSVSIPVTFSLYINDALIKSVITKIVYGGYCVNFNVLFSEAITIQKGSKITVKISESPTGNIYTWLFHSGDTALTPFSDIFCERVFINNNGVVTEQIGYKSYIDLILNPFDPFPEPPLNRRQFNNQR